MDNSEKNLVHDRKPASKSKVKKKPMKVVYISNPMKFETEASEFRALVQELTGQDAEFPDPTKPVDSDSVGGHGQAASEAAKSCSSCTTVADDLPSGVPRVDLLRSEQTEAIDGCLFDPFEEVYMPQMLEFFQG